MADIAQRGEVVIIRQRLPEGARGGVITALISNQPALEIIDKCLSLRRRRAPAQPGTDKGGGKVAVIQRAATKGSKWTFMRSR